MSESFLVWFEVAFLEILRVKSILRILSAFERAV
jgi:hypothetical protein